MRFGELKRATKSPIAAERVVDTPVLARRNHAGGLTLDDTRMSPLRAQVAVTTSACRP
jgi:hypothetical protein